MSDTPNGSRLGPWLPRALVGVIIALSGAVTTLVATHGETVSVTYMTEERVERRIEEKLSAALGPLKQALESAAASNDQLRKEMGRWGERMEEMRETLIRLDERARREESRRGR